MDRAARIFGAMRGYVARNLEHFAAIERLGARLATLEEVAAAGGAVLFFESPGRLAYASPAAQALFARLWGLADPPPRLVDRCAALDRKGDLALADAEPFAFGGRALVIRAKRTSGPRGRALLVTLADPEEESKAALGERCRALGLTPRESEVAVLVARGLRNEQIARELGMAVQTVKNHLAAIYERARTRNRAALVRVLLEPRA